MISCIISSMTQFLCESQTVSGVGVSFDEVGGLKREIESLRNHLSALSEATLRITDDLDLDVVLQEVIDAACSLTRARYGALLILDPDGGMENFITSGITPEGIEAIKAKPKVAGLLGFLNEVEGPMRLRDIARHPSSIGFPEGHPSMKSFLGTPVRHRGERLGNIYLTEKEDGREFTPEDEEIISVFASHAATAISNARKHRDERQAKADVETLNERYFRLFEAVRILSESLDVDTVLDQIVTGARVLTGAHYGLITTIDESGQLVDFGTSGFTPEERQLMTEMPRGTELLDYYHSIPHSWRVPDARDHIRDLGFQGMLPPFRATLYTPVYFHGTRLGNFYLSNKEDGPEFTESDEELMNVFAAQAAISIVNARAHEAERQARANLEILVDTSPVGVAVFDAKTMDAVLLNEETRRIVGGLYGMGRSLERIFQLLPVQRPDGSKVPMKELPPVRALTTGETVRAEEIIVSLPNGQSVTVLASAAPTFSQNGEITSIVSTLQDMTPLEDLMRQRSEFLGMVSHELRTPLTTIKGATATALDSSTTVDVAEMVQFFRIIDEQTSHMRHLISDLLDVTRIDAGTLSVIPEPTDVETLVEGVRSTLLRGGARNSVDIDLPHDLPRINADRQRITQVLNNLLSNASKYSPDQSTIRVTASVDDVYVNVSISDEGRGISPQHLPLLFRKFSLIEGDVMSPGEHGNGLGLAICRGIVEAHGGRIWAESDGEGLGTRVTFTIPTVDDTAPDSTAASDSPAAVPISTSGDRVRILAVDDEMRVLRHIRNTLSKAGYSPTVTANPNEVTRLIKAENPHLILMDLMLPGTDGIELTKSVLKITNAPVIFVSGNNEDQAIERAFKAGADDYIVKPFSPNELIARIQAVLRRQSSQGRWQTREPYLLGDLMIDYTERLVTVAGRPVHLTSTEYKLLTDLSTNAGRVLSHDQLLRRVWGPGYVGDSQHVRTFVKNLRNKLGDSAKNPTYIFTEPRVGYRMAKPRGEGAIQTRK